MNPRVCDKSKKGFPNTNKGDYFCDRIKKGFPNANRLTNPFFKGDYFCDTNERGVLNKNTQAPFSKREIPESITELVG